MTREQRSIRLLPETWARLEVLAAKAGTGIPEQIERLVKGS